MLILCGLLGQMGAISDPEGLGVMSSCGQCLRQVLLPAGLQQGEAGQENVCCTAMVMLRNVFISRDLRPEKSMQSLKIIIMPS